MTHFYGTYCFFKGTDTQNGKSVLHNQGCGSASGFDPDSIGSVDPDPDSESGSGPRRAKMTHNSRQKKFKSSCFEVLDGLF